MLEERANRNEDEKKILKSIFPEMFVHNDIDLDLLHDSLEKSGIRVIRRESYGFSWAGKTEARSLN